MFIVRALRVWSAALTGLMMILVGSMIPSAILLPKFSLPIKFITLSSSWQIPGLLLCALVSGPQSALIASVAYLTIGIFFLPIFQGGGSIGYLLTPEFGYLIGFIPAAWITGKAAQKLTANNFFGLFISTIYGVIIIQTVGTLNLVVGTTLTNWPEPIQDLIFKYTLIPMTSQILICPSLALTALIIRRFLLIK